MKKKKNGNIPLTKSSQQRKTARGCKTPMKSIGSYVFSVLDPTFGCFCKISRNRECLLKLYMLAESARSVSRELCLEKRVYTGLTSWLTEDVATMLCCYAKFVFMLITIGLWPMA